MTETSIEPVAVPAATPPPSASPPSSPASSSATDSASSGVAHTPGGYPVLPLALSGTNSAVGAVSTMALVGGGPAALAVVGGGAAVLGTVAAVRARRRTKDKDKSKSKTRGGGGAKGRTTGLASSSHRAGSSRGLSPLRSAGGGSAGGRKGGSSAASRTSGAGRHAARDTSRTATASGSGKAGNRRDSAGRRAGAGRLGEVRALRRDGKAQAPTRAAARERSTAARRAVADARRAARTARTGKTPGASGPGRLKRTAGRAGGRAASGTRALVNKARAARDRATAAQVDAKRAHVRKAPARRRAWWALAKSAARFHGRRMLAALVGGAAGVLGCVTTPLGRKLGWSWLMHPGRRLYRRLTAVAREQQAVRDEEIRARRAEEEAAADGDPHEIGDKAERPARIVPATATTGEFKVSGFKFEEAAAEMESAAREYEPDGNMEVFDMIKNLPTAMQSIANTFRILAERADEEFAFEKDVAIGFDDLHRRLLDAVDDAETLAPLFARVHEHDIARHEDPRNGTEAEKGWNV